MVRTPCCDKSGLKKGTWTPEEDRKLMAYVNSCGSWNWRQLPKYAGLARCGKSCRLRWMNYLRPNIKRGNYTKEEEDTIIKLHESLGNKWSAIAAQLPGRTDNEIKNHWHTNLKKLKKQNSTTSEFEEKVNLNDNISLFETSKEKEILMEVPTINYSSLNPTTHQILESSPFSPQPSLSELSSSSSISTTDTAAVSSSNLVAYDNSASFETYEIFSGTFWTEPFVADSAYNITNDFMVPSVESGLLYGVYDGDDGLNW